MADLDSKPAEKTPPGIDWYDFSGAEQLFPPVPGPKDPCEGRSCELPKRGETGDRPQTGGGSNFYGVESAAVLAYRQGQGSRKAGGEVAQDIPAPPQPGRDGPQPGRDAPGPVGQGRDVYEAKDAAEAFKYAKDNNLPIFLRLSSEGCGPCRGMKPMWAKAEQDLRGKAVFIHVDADNVGNLDPQAAALINPIIAGTTGIPAVWRGRAVDDGNGGARWEGSKLQNPFGVSQMLNELRRTPAPRREVGPQPGPNPNGTRDILPPPEPGQVRGGGDQPIPTGDNPVPATGGQEVYQGNDILAAQKFAKENNLPMFTRLGADWCPGCVGMKGFWAGAQTDLKGKAVFVNIDADKVKNNQYSEEALAVIRPMIKGTASIPAVWYSDHNAQGNLSHFKLDNAGGAYGMIDELKKGTFQRRR